MRGTQGALNARRVRQRVVNAFAEEKPVAEGVEEGAAAAAAGAGAGGGGGGDMNLLLVEMGVTQIQFDRVIFLWFSWDLGVAPL